MNRERERCPAKSLQAVFEHGVASLPSVRGNKLQFYASFLTVRPAAVPDVEQPALLTRLVEKAFQSGAMALPSSVSILLSYTIMRNRFCRYDKVVEIHVLIGQRCKFCGRPTVKTGKEELINADISTTGCPE